MNLINRFWFRRAVRHWRVKVRLHRELVKEIRKLQAECMDHNANPLIAKLNVQFLDLIMPDYRMLDDELRERHLLKMMQRQGFKLVSKAAM